MQDTAYIQAKAVADAAFEDKLKQFSFDLEKVVKRWSAHGYATLPDQAVGEMAITTGRYLAEAANMLQWLYERAFVQAPVLQPNTLAAIKADLARHISEQLEIIVATYQGKVKSCGGQVAANTLLSTQLKHLRGQIEQVVLAILRRRS
jgi:hypothetical protein